MPMQLSPLPAAGLLEQLLLPALEGSRYGSTAVQLSRNPPLLLPPRLTLKAGTAAVHGGVPMPSGAVGGLPSSTPLLRLCWLCCGVRGGTWQPCSSATRPHAASQPATASLLVARGAAAEAMAGRRAGSD